MAGGDDGDDDANGGDGGEEAGDLGEAVARVAVAQLSAAPDIVCSSRGGGAVDAASC